MSHKVPVPKTAENIRAMAKTLAEQAQDLNAIAAAMDSLEFQELPITNDDQRKRGLAFIEKWLCAARTAIREARESRGDYGRNGLSVTG